MIEQIAAELLEAYQTRTPVQPLTERFPDLQLVDAYAIQVAQIEKRQSEGAKPKGHKVGLTSRAMQQMLGVDQPDYGRLLDDMFYSEGVPIRADHFLAPRIEPEIAFVLQSSLAGPGVTVVDAIGAVDFVLPALEIIDSRIQDWKIKLIDTIADNASAGGVVLGARCTHLGDGAPDLRLVGCNLWQNGVIVQTGAGGAVLGNPLLALVWLANALGDLGVELQPGSVVLPGSCTAAVPVEDGDIVVADFGALGTVQAMFTSGDNR